MPRLMLSSARILLLGTMLILMTGMFLNTVPPSFLILQICPVPSRHPSLETGMVKLPYPDARLTAGNSLSIATLLLTYFVQDQLLITRVVREVGQLCNWLLPLI